LLEHIKRLGGDSLLYALMNVGTKIIAFIMLPIYTHFLPNPSDYGQLDILDRITSMLSFLVIFGTDSALAFYYFDTKDEEERQQYVKNVMLFRLGVVCLLLVITTAGGKWFAEIFLENQQLTNLLFWSMFTLLFDTVTTLVLTVLRYEFKTVKVVTLTLVKMLLTAVLSYLFLRFLDPSIEGILISRLVAAVIISVFILRETVKFIKFTFDKEIIKEILVYAAPSVPASIAFWVIINSNSMFLQKFTSSWEVGIYGAATRFASLITLLTSGVQMAWRPYSMSMKDKPNSKDIFAKIFMAIWLLGMIGVLIVATIMPKVILLLHKNYYDAYKYVAPISAVTFLNFFYMIVSVGIFIKKETKYISYAFGIAAVLDVILNLTLIPLFSIWGSVAAYLISYVVAFVYIFFKSQKIYYVPVSFGKMSTLFITMLIAVFLIIYIQEHHFSWLYIAAIWLGYLGTIGVCRVDKDFKKAITQTN
jgi:O-antigen/teichoic acid export membrane protein